MVYDYFRLIDEQDLDGVLSPFSDDAIVYEPFSRETNGLTGKAAIRDFLRITIMANAGSFPAIEFANRDHEDGYATERDLETNEITALVTFQDDPKLKGKFQFTLVAVVELLEDWRGYSMALPSKRIKELRIQVFK